MKTNYYRRIIKIFDELKKSHPKYNLGKHVATALDGHDVWSVSDKDFLIALTEYKNELEIDVQHSDNDIEDIIKQGMNLNKWVLEDDEQETFYD